MAKCAQLVNLDKKYMGVHCTVLTSLLPDLKLSILKNEAGGTAAG